MPARVVLLHPPPAGMKHAVDEETNHSLYGAQATPEVRLPRPAAGAACLLSSGRSHGRIVSASVQAGLVAVG